ncbi:hypothetical protein H483_0108045 [Dietzia sp. UCD-THP]|uniref:hypothetical protein n=1 Tax=Dietzia sp. UCD-THP TaxID=1292020 RepID=UPI00038227E6|nr:hypothetical protein [Dietzia sp. UCD-THP]EYT63354.1 hypothetical protein H483_0108045 [Dietzia sp. UCD-THP]
MALLALTGCSRTDSEPASPPPETATAAPVEPTEILIALGEPFTVDGPNYTADITIDRIYVPETCNGSPNESLAIAVDVDVESGDGTAAVLNTGTIRERTPDGYLKKDRVVSRTCDSADELDAINVQTGDKYQGIIWLADDINTESELLISTPTGGGPITKVFVLDLSSVEIVSVPAAPVVAPPAAAPAEPAQDQAEPYVVECIFGTPGPSRMSDGTIQNTDFCANQPGAAESRYLESNCSDMAWRHGMGLEGDRLCGSSHYEDGATGGN